MWENKNCSKNECINIFFESVWCKVWRVSNNLVRKNIFLSNKFNLRAVFYLIFLYFSEYQWVESTFIVKKNYRNKNFFMSLSVWLLRRGNESSTLRRIRQFLIIFLLVLVTPLKRSLLAFSVQCFSGLFQKLHHEFMSILLSVRFPSEELQ